MMELLLPSPEQKLFIPRLNHEIIFKRDDLIHPIDSGNKWRKLKYHLTAFEESKKKCIVSIGGAHSNHLHALSYLCFQLQIPCKLLIYGSPNSTIENNTLQDCLSWGASIDYISRREAKSNFFSYASDDYFIEEGGKGEIAQQGMGELVDELIDFEDNSKTLIAVAYGTGTSVQALLKKTNECHVVTLSPVKNNQLLQHSRLHYLIDYLNLSFAGFSNEYYSKITAFQKETSILLDPVYTGKLYLNLIHSSINFMNYNKIYFVHSGGLQAWRDYRQRYKDKIIAD